jgi:hypothetical protein
MLGMAIYRQFQISDVLISYIYIFRYIAAHLSIGKKLKMKIGAICSRTSYKTHSQTFVMCLLYRKKDKNDFDCVDCGFDFVFFL